MTDPAINDLVPTEFRGLVDQGVQQAKKAFDDLMSATKHAVSTFEGQASAAQDAGRGLQRKVVEFSERNVAGSLEFAQKLLRAKDAEEVLKLHAEYVQEQLQSLTVQAQEIAQHAAQVAGQGRNDG